ncbi:hypothetical protein [Roseisolibacter agri]|uniref:Uncharacterized protein n=1 Tax=Roseisolibacter agri TaxID=2014610 RepID=A0AA37V0F1_9BACT|nr:hypothetical protein [Roseisolibacter agri]GLC24355.1 hypothetical protein rosag_08680 [Roseisolibacter agri]
MPASVTLASAALAAVTLLAVPGAAHAQLVGVPVPPPRPVPAAVAAAAAADSADPNRPKPFRADTAAIIQKLDIQAWVDSAAPALARAPRPAPAVVTPVPRVDPAPPAVAPATRPATPPRRTPARPSQDARRPAPADSTARPSRAP